MPFGPADALLRVENLTKHYGRVPALTDASFCVRPKEVLGLIGPNGSGKTTLFDCIGGVMPFDAGTVVPSPTRGWPAAFYLPDGIVPWADRTLDWVQRYVLGFFAADATARDEVNARLDLQGILQQRIRTLSKGQRKRALLSVGLLTPHSILMADEPFDGLDLRQQRDAASLLRETAGRGRSLLLSIHQIADAARVCDRFILLSGGRIRGIGTLPELRVQAGCAAEAHLEEVFLALT